MAKFLLSVVIPSFNEMTNLQKGVLEKMHVYLSKKDTEFRKEVIIVDDGSNDGSREFAERFAKTNRDFKIIKNKHLGKAGAVTTGMLAAKGDYVLFTDMDQAAPIEEIEKLLPYTKLGYDIIIGSRNSRRKGAPFSRIIMAKGMIFLRSAIVGLAEIKDTQCGFKLFTKKAAKDIFSKLYAVHHGFEAIHGSSVTAGFDTEILYIGKQMGYKIQEVPIEWLYVETRRVSPLTDSIEGLIELIRIKKNILGNVY